MNYNTKKLEIYNTKSLEDKDLCGTLACNTPNGTYITKNKMECSFSNFGNQTPCSSSIQCSSSIPCPEGYQCDQIKNACIPIPLSDDCYKEGDNPFALHCKKTDCCNGTQLRLHPADNTHKDPYYICSSNTSYREIPPKCDSKNTSAPCLTSAFCKKQPNDSKLEVFYYSNGRAPNSGFTYEEAKNIASNLSFPIASYAQILDAYHNGFDIPTCLWGWGSDGAKYWCSRTVGIDCDGNKSVGFYQKQPSPNEKCGIFLYGVKPMENSIVNCINLTTNQLCILPWCNGLNQWSKYSQLPTSPACYENDEDIFHDQCKKGVECCNGSTLCRDKNYKYYCHKGDTCKSGDYKINSDSPLFPKCPTGNCNVKNSKVCKPK